MRLIDADALMEKYHKTTVWDSWVEINNAPTVDAEPVVRCKDCKYWDNGRCEGIRNGLIREYTYPNDYCSYGEWKDESDGMD